MQFNKSDVIKKFTSKGAVLSNSNAILLQADSFLQYNFSPSQLARGCYIEMEFFVKTPESLILSMEPFHVVLGDEFGHSYISRTLPCNYLVRGEDFEILADSINVARFEYEKGGVSVELNGKTATFESEYVPTIDRLKLYAASDCVIEKFDIEIDVIEKDFSIQPANDFQLQMTFDFYDDILTAPCTMTKLDELMKINSDMGVKRIRWIDHGEREQGFWDQSNNLRLVDQFVKESFDSLGDHVKAGCELAHKHAMEFYTILKPFDMAIMGHTFGIDSPEGNLGKEGVVGGNTALALDYPAKNKQLCMQRRPEKFNFNKPVRIVLKSLTNIPLDTEFEIWVSENNSEYVQYSKPLKVSIDNKTAVIFGLDMTQDFFAVTVKTKQKENSIFNEVQQLISVYDENGKQIDITLSLQPREFRDLFSLENHLNPLKIIGGDFRQGGFFFDYINMGMPTGVFPAVTSKIKCVALDNAYRSVGVAVDVNKNIPGVMSPSEADARGFWFEMIQHALDCGVDGVDIRVTSHINVLDFEKYGFNDAVVDEYKKRHGVDIREEDFDIRLLRKIRGEFYTQFLKEAGDLVHAHGKKFCIHISDMFEGTPDSSMMMEIFWDWQKWLDVVKPDEVTFKSFRADGFKSHMGKTLVSMCQQRNIKINYCPFVHTLIQANGIELVEEMADSGINSFDFYENATMFRLQKDGSLLCLMPEVKEYFERNNNET